MDLYGKIDELLEKDCYVADMFPTPQSAAGTWRAVFCGGTVFPAGQ